MMKLNDVTIERVVYEPPEPLEEGELLVWNSINPPTHMRYYRVGTPNEGAQVIGHLAAEQLKDDKIHSNAFGLMRSEPKVVEAGGDLTRVDGLEWCEWYDDEGRDVDEAFENTLDKAVSASMSEPNELDLEEEL
jgi:hypothetical protein